jgi:hypothetical protein
MTEIAIKVQHAARKWRELMSVKINRIKYLSGELGSDFVRRVLRAKSRRERGEISFRCIARVLCFSLFILLENGFVKFVVIVLLIRFRFRLVEDSVEL